MDFVQKVMKIKICERDIERAHRLHGQEKPRNMVVKFANYCTREEVFKAKWSLPEDNKVFIWEDFSDRVRQERKFLLEELKKAKQRKEKATLSFNVLKINGKSYKYDWNQCKVVMVGEQRPKRKRDVTGSSPQQEGKMNKAEDVVRNRQMEVGGPSRSRSGSCTSVRDWLQRPDPNSEA